MMIIIIIIIIIWYLILSCLCWQLWWVVVFLGVVVFCLLPKPIQNHPQPEMLLIRASRIALHIQCICFFLEKGGFFEDSSQEKKARWWFQPFLFHLPAWGDDSIWLTCFQWVAQPTTRRGWASYLLPLLSLDRNSIISGANKPGSCHIVPSTSRQLLSHVDDFPNWRWTVGYVDSLEDIHHLRY